MRNQLIKCISRRQICRSAAVLMAITLSVAVTAQFGFGQSTTQSTEPSRTIIPVKFNPATGGIAVGSTLYNGANPGFHVLAVSRQLNPAHLNAPDILLDQTYNDAASVTNALKAIQQTYAYPTAMVMVNAVGNYGIPLSAVSAALTNFGAYPDLQGINAAPPLVFIGTGGANAKTALQRGVSTRELDGYLAPDSNGYYAFLQTDYVHYDIGLDGTITIGKTTHKAADAPYKPGCDASATDSLHLLVVDRESPDVVLADNVYCTGQHPELLGGMATDVSGIAAENQLVFIATKGHPVPVDWNFGTNGDARIARLAQQMARFGGYYETVVYLTPSDTYSLIGAPPAVAGTPNPGDRARESSSVYPDKPSGALHGVLARSRGNWYSPLNADTSGLANLGLYDILAQTPAPFPHPVGSDELAAFQYINNALCGTTTCNVRNDYNNAAINIGTTYQTPLQGMTKDQSGNDCTDKNNAGLPYCVVRQQLLNEFIDVSNIRALYGNMSELWLASGSTSILSLLSTYNDVKATIPVVATAQSPSLVRPLVGFFLGLAGNIPVVGPAFGLADTAFNLGMDLTTDPKGNRTVDLTSTIGQMQDTAIDHFQAQANNTGTMFALIYQDWGKIDALGSALLSSANEASSPWSWKPGSTTSLMLNNMEPAVKQAAYQSLLGAAYSIGRYLPQTGGSCFGNGAPVWGKTPLYNQPWGYGALDGDFKGCNLGLTPVVQPFNSTAAGYIPYTYPTDSTNPYVNDARTGTIMADYSWLAISLQTSPYSGGPNGVYNPPGPTLLSTLFTPVSQGGLGVYRPAFFEAWPFPHFDCAPSFGVRTPDSSGSYVGGCDWTSGKAAVSLPPPGPTSVSIRATHVSSEQSQAQVLLTLHNNGSVPANSIEITSLSLRTLAGSGEATVVSPSLPAVFNGLAPGDSTDVIVTLNIPAGIKKLQIMELGTADLGQPEPTRFSDGEVIYPGK